MIKMADTFSQDFGLQPEQGLLPKGKISGSKNDRDGSILI
jgi:hypothetical protein